MNWTNQKIKKDPSLLVLKLIAVFLQTNHSNEQKSNWIKIFNACLVKQGLTSADISHTSPTLHVFIFTGMMVPSLTSAVYFFVFLGLCTWWSCCQAFDPLIFSCLCVLMAIFSAGHLIGLYLYQLQFFQEVVPPKDFYARWEKFLSCLIVGM